MAGAAGIFTGTFDPAGRPFCRPPSCSGGRSSITPGLFDLRAHLDPSARSCAEPGNHSTPRPTTFTRRSDGPADPQNVDQRRHDAKPLSMRAVSPAIPLINIGPAASSSSRPSGRSVNRRAPGRSGPAAVSGDYPAGSAIRPGWRDLRLYVPGGPGRVPAGSDPEGNSYTSLPANAGGELMRED